MSLIEEIANYLQGKGLGTVGTDIFVSFIPDVPEEGIFILDTGGFPPDKEVPIDNPTIQIRVRSVTYTAGHDKIWAIYDELNRNIEYNLGTTRVLYSFALQNPVHIGRDGMGREEFSVNIHFHIIR